MLLERFREPIAKQSKHSTVCRRGNPIPVLLAGLAGLLFSAGHAAAQASPTWMGDLKPRIGHLQLNQLAIPGTHDTGTYSLDRNSILSDDFPLSSFQQEADTDLSYADPLGIFGLVSAFNSAFNGLLNPIIYNWAEAQDYAILDQLNAGIRYFDIRPCPYPAPSSNPSDVTDIKICHSLFGASVTDVMASVKQFSLAHPDEIIIMDFNHITGHNITGDVSQNFAESIIRSFSNQTTGDMLIPFSVNVVSKSAATLTLAQIWTQPARIVALYDDPSVFGAGLLWPGQDVPANSPIAQGAGIAALIDSPWPNTDNVQTQLSTDSGYMSCRCDNPQQPSSSTPNTLFVLQTNPTPSTAMIGGYLINQIENDTAGLLNPVLEILRSQEGFESSTPSGLRDLADQANAAILQMPTADIVTSVASLSSQNPPAPPCQTKAQCAQLQGLRQNLNIVQADRFEEMYDPNGNVVPSNFANSMVQLDVPPQSTLSIGSPQHSAGQQLFVTGATPFTVQATDAYFGVLNVSYDYLSGTSTWQQSRGPRANFTLAAPALDGPYTITSFATNNAGLPEGPNTKGVTLDNTAPVITVTQPAAGFAYPHSSTLTLNYGVTDGSGSGVKSVTSAVLDGAGAIGGQTLTSGLAINLLTQLSLGSHTFTFGSATDNLGNVRPATTVTFTLIATASSIEGDVTQFVGSGAISDASWSTSLSNKLSQAAALRSAGDCSDAASVYNAFINEVSAQSGKKVTPVAATIMTNDANYLIAHCP